MVLTAAMIWADGPPSAPTDPNKQDIRDWGTWLESAVNAFLANGGLVYTTRAALYVDLAHAANTAAWVIGDTTVAYNGIYVKSGASGVGSWSRVSDLPFSFIIATDAGAGTPNAIQATSSIPVSASALVWLQLADTNTGSPVTISFNGGSALTIKTNGGNDPIAGGLPANTIVMGIVAGSTFRLVSDQASSAILAACEAAEAAAAAYADFARNNWVNQGPFVGTGASHDFLLSVDPGTANNIFVTAGGVDQQLSNGDYSLVYTSGSPYLRINIPAGIPIEVRISNAVPVNTPADGSVTTAKIADGNVTDVKMASQKVNRTGDTMTGPLTTPTVNIDNTVAGGRVANFKTSGSQRWAVRANGTAESGSNLGSDFAINNYNDSGALIGTPVIIARNTGVVSVPSAAIAALAVSSSLSAPSLTISGAAGSGTRVEHWQTSGVDRFVSGLDSGAESGSNAGTNFFMNTYDDSGAFIATAMSIARATAIMSLAKPLKLPSYTIATLPSAAANPQGIAYVSDNTGNKRLVVSDGTNWRYPDGNLAATVSSGAWTPALQFGGAAVGMTYSAQEGTYFRMGRWLYISGHIALSAKGSSTGIATITGIPVAPAAPYAAELNVSFYSNMATSTSIFGTISGGATSAQLYIPGAATQAAALDTNFTATSVLYFSALIDTGAY